MTMKIRGFLSVASSMNLMCIVSWFDYIFIDFIWDKKPSHFCWIHHHSGLNESIPNSGLQVLKYYSERFKDEPYLLSQKSIDSDDENNPVEMLFYVRK